MTNKRGCVMSKKEFDGIMNSYKENRRKKIFEIAILGILTALYVVCSLTLKIPMGVGNIALDMGYIVLTVACMKYGWKGCIVGGLGACIESILFSAYGISYGWIVMNIIIGLIVGFAFMFIKIKNPVIKYIVFGCIIIFSCLIGVAAKTVIECTLYSIPYVVKIPKSAVAWGIDSLVMLVGMPIGEKISSYDKKRGKKR